MWGFPKVILPTDAIMVLLGITLVASRFSLPMEVVTVSIHGLSPLPGQKVWERLAHPPVQWWE